MKNSARFGALLRSITVVDVPFSMLADGNHVILIHAGPDDSSAANEQVIPAGSSRNGRSRQPEQLNCHQPLPSTGAAGSDSNTFAIFMTLAAVVLAGTLIVAGGVTVSKRR